jgi:hypothetical protein
MKIIASLITILFAFNQLCAQSEQPDRSLGIYYSVLTKNKAISDLSPGSPSYQANGYYSIGFDYLYSICSCSAYEIGIEYSSHSITKISAVDINNNFSSSGKISLLTIPISYRIVFFKYLFINPGAFIDLDFSNSGLFSNQTGFGASIGIGLKFNFKSGIGLYINPFYKSHSWVTFSTATDKLRITESGIKLGLVYKFNKVDNK